MRTCRLHSKFVKPHYKHRVNTVYTRIYTSLQLGIFVLDMYGFAQRVLLGALKMIELKQMYIMYSCWTPRGPRQTRRGLRWHERKGVHKLLVTSFENMVGMQQGEAKTNKILKVVYDKQKFGNLWVRINSAGVETSLLI